MKLWAVGFYNLYDNTLIIEIVTAPSWQDAITTHSQVGEMKFDHTDLEKAKIDFFNCDSGIDVVEIP